MPEIAWRPTPEQVAASTVGRFMAEHGIADFAALLARSIDEPEWFWDAVVNISGGTEVGAWFLSAHVPQALSPCSLGGPALGMAIDVCDEAGRPVRGRWASSCARSRGRE